MEIGRYEAAGDPLSRAMLLNSNDPLGQCIAAAALLHTGKVDSAAKTYARVLETDPAYGPALFGRGIAELARRRYDASLSSLRAAAPLLPAGCTEGALAYLEALRSGFRSVPSAKEADPLAMQTAAFAIYRAGRAIEAAAAMAPLVADAPNCGASEAVGIVATFDESKPLAFTANGRLPASLADLHGSKLPRVSGAVLLKADTSRLKRPAYVVFQIDGSTAAIVNTEPYDFSWNTTTVINGVHTVRIVSYDHTNVPFAEREQRVVVANKQSPPADRTEPERKSALFDRLCRLATLKPSYWVASYISGKAALARGERARASAMFERCVALDPDRADARKLYREACAAPCVFREVKSAPVSAKVIALTFDDGPAQSTEAILNALKDAGAKATFFIVGTRALESPDVVRRIAAEGHELGNHTYSHRNLELIRRDEIDRELMKNAVILRSLSGASSRLFRPPGGHLSRQARQALAEYGLTCVLWTFNCGTFENASAVKYTEQVLRDARPGAIMLMHNGEEVTTAALPGILAALKQRGYQFVTVSELVRAGG